MNKSRPVNLDIGTMRLPITAYVSILHRISGVFLAAGVAVLLWMLDASLESEAGFAEVATLFDSFIFKLVVWLVLAALIYHTAAGIRHMVMDVGVGESLKGGQLGAKIVLVVTVVLTILVGALIW